MAEYSIFELLHVQTSLLKKYADTKRSRGRALGRNNPGIQPVLDELARHLGNWQCLCGDAIQPSMKKYIQGYIDVADAVITGRQCNTVYYEGELSQGTYMLADYFATLGTIREDFFREWGAYEKLVYSVMLDGMSVTACENAIMNAAAVVEKNLRYYMRDDRCFPNNHP